MKKKRINIVLIVMLIGGFIIYELAKQMTGSIPSQNEVKKMYRDNKEDIDFIASYITNFARENEHFYITPESIELVPERYGKVRDTVVIGQDFKNAINYLFNNSKIVLIYDDYKHNYIVFEAECKHSFVFNGIAIAKNGNEPSWEFVKLQKKEYIADGVYYFEGE